MSSDSAAYRTRRLQHIALSVEEFGMSVNYGVVRESARADYLGARWLVRSCPVDSSV